MRRWTSITAAVAAVGTPPGLADADIAELRDTVDRLHGSDAWRTALARNGCTDAYLTGEQFTTFVQEESNRVQRELNVLGLTGTS